MNRSAFDRRKGGYGRIGQGGSLLAGLCAAALLAGCQSNPEPRALIVPRVAKAEPKEYFSEASVGVKASPRVAHPSARKRLRRGGGRAMVGKPYQVRGKWYYPQEMASYRKSGSASWYGSAFHGRLTANGEIYDMNALSAAHPTMPLPSYARVTNQKNGSSVIVRVNDRGPYHGGRIMDLSKRAAELLDYTHSGTARVDVEYIGPAPVDGNDDQYLMASYRPAGGGASPSDGLATGVMLASAGPADTIALAGSTPNGAPAAAFPGALTDRAAPVVPAALAPVDAMPVLPEIGPVVPERPPFRVAYAVSSARLGYAAEPGALAAFGALARDGLSPAAILQSRANPAAETADDFVAVGVFADEGEAKAVAAALDVFGAVTMEAVSGEGRRLVAITARPEKGGSIDALLTAAWGAGAADAFIVRD